MPRRQIALHCLIILAVALLGCDEERFEVPKHKRARHGLYKQRMLAAKPIKPTTQRPATRPKSIPKGLTLQHAYGPTGSFASFSLAPSGQLALVGGSHHKLYQLGLPKGKRQRTWHGFQHAIQHISISPTGRRVAIQEGTHTLSIWSINGTLQKRINTPHTLTTMQFAPVSNQILALTQSGKLLFFHGSTLALKRQQQICPQKNPATSLSVDAYQKWMGIGCQSGHLWLGRFGQSGKRFATQQPVSALALSPKDTLVAIGTQQGQLQIWKLKQGTNILRRTQSIQGHIRAINHMAFTNDGTTLATGSLDRHVSLWTHKQGVFQLTKQLRHSASITGLAWHPEHQDQLLTTSLDGTFRTWKMPGTRMVISSPSTYTGGRLSFNPKRPWLVSHGEKGFAVWDLNTGQRTLASSAHPHNLLTIQFAQDGNHMLAADRDNIVFWDLYRRKYIDVVYPPKGTHITSATLGAEWTQVWFGTPLDGVFLWTIAGKRILYRHSSPKYISAVAYHPRSRRAVAATIHGTIYFYDMRAKRFLHKQTLPPSSAPLRHVAFSKNGKQIVVAKGTNAYLISWNTPKQHKSIPMPSTITAVRFLNKQIAFGLQNHQLVTWSLTKQTTTHTSTPCHTPIAAIDVSPTRPILATACNDGSVKLLRQKNKTLISTHIPLSGTQWISYTPQLELVGSTEAFQQFFFAAANKRYSLRSFQGWFTAPKRVKHTLSSIR
jgi:COMPASS component SWD3